MATEISWTDETWNPIVGCSIVSPGCTNCYAMRKAWRLMHIGSTKDKYEGTVRKSGKRPVWTGRLNFHEKALRQPYGWPDPRMVFVNSMSDLFHEAVPEEWIQTVWAVMAETPRHTYQILTKRPERLAELAPKLDLLPNVWLGVSVENDDYLWRIDMLRKVPARVRFLSLEPLLGPLPALDLSGIDWVIVGGESGPAYRTMEPEWARDIRDQCTDADVAFFFKQWSAPKPKVLGKEIDGREWCQFPG